jgi:DNA-binding CsgD family transcriptional regulator
MGITDFCHCGLNTISDALDTFGTYPSTLLDAYAREGFQQEDIMIRHVQSIKSADSHLFQAQINDYVNAAPFENDLFKLNGEIIKLLYQHKIYDAYNIVILEPNYRAFLAVSSHNCESAKFQQIVQDNLPNLRVLANAVDNIGRKKFRSHFHNEKVNPRIPIHSRPLQLLATLKKDLTLNEAAEVLHMSISTANQHVAAAKKALGAYTTHGAILAAIQQGLIDP